MRIAIVVLSSVLLANVSAQERVRRVGEPRRDHAEQAKLDASSTIVKGQCVDGKTGKPLAGCTVKLRPWGRSTEDIPSALKKPESVLTGDDGKFAIRVVANEAYQVGFDASFPGRWPRTGRWRHLVPGELVDVGAVKLHKGVQAVGKVVDQQGEPVAGVTVGIDGLGLYLGSEDDGNKGARRGFVVGRAPGKPSRAMHFAANGLRWCTSGADGKFFSRDSLPAGEFGLLINNSSVTLAGTKTITIPESGPMTAVTIVVQEEPFLSGLVVDENGDPVKGVTVRAELKRSGRMASARTRADGSFKVYRVENSPDAVRLTVPNPGPCEIPAPTKKFEWGTSGIKIELQHALTVAITVVEAGTGKPIEDYSVRAYPNGDNRFSGLEQRIRLSGKHEEGKLAIDSVRRGQSRISVIPKDPQLLCVDLNIVAVDGMKPLRIEVQRLVPMMVQVLDAKGAPVHKANVLVIAPGNEQRGDSDHFINPRSDGGTSATGPGTIPNTLVYRTVTDGGGQCIAYGIADRKDLVIAVRLADGTLHRDPNISFGSDGNGHTVKLKN